MNFFNILFVICCIHNLSQAADCNAKIDDYFFVDHVLAGGLDKTKSNLKISFIDKQDQMKLAEEIRDKLSEFDGQLLAIKAGIICSLARLSFRVDKIEQTINSLKPQVKDIDSLVKDGEMLNTSAPF